VPDKGPVAERGPDRFIIADYDIFDDTPPSPPPPTLDQRKQALAVQLHQAAAAARATMISPARLQLLQLDYSAAIATPESARSPADIAVIAAMNAFQDRCVEIDRVVAVAAVDLEERTEANVDAFRLPAF
jgi:hypothetical protein